MNSPMASKTATHSPSKLSAKTKKEPKQTSTSRPRKLNDLDLAKELAHPEPYKMPAEEDMYVPPGGKMIDRDELMPEET